MNEASEGYVPQELEQNEKETKKYPFEGGIIVFGHGWSKEAKVGGGWQLSPEAYMRAVAAYQLWKEGLAPRIILTGGEPGENGKSEYGPNIEANSRQMAKFLMEKFGVPEEAIEVEEKSIKTVDNVAHALNVLQEKNLPTDNFLVVSTGYHMDRIGSIMEKFGLKYQPKTAEEELNDRARVHAEKMREIERRNGALNEEEIAKNYQMQKSRYERVVQRFKRDNASIAGQMRNEPTYLKAMQERPGFWLPLALAVRGEKLGELVDTHRKEIETWLERHPDMNVTIEDLIAGDFDYHELVAKGREMPQ